MKLNLNQIKSHQFKMNFIVYNSTNSNIWMMIIIIIIIRSFNI